MATYKHGVYTSEQATSMTAPVTGTAGLQVVVGTAPVNRLKDTGLPWLKEKRLYSIVKKFVEAAEKQAEAGTIDKATKKRFVVELLEANGITVTPEIDAFIEAAVKELDLAEKNAIGEIGKIFSDTEQTPQD